MDYKKLRKLVENEKFEELQLEGDEYPDNNRKLYQFMWNDKTVYLLHYLSCRQGMNEEAQKHIADIVREKINP